ncbi:MAG: hypothetical protein ACD_71C00124G0007 [uncultured bacterium (gcode 4)]|uniref:Uncharacterized protein n=1 Tax=uncultured bacterium (gcode 4) TaxID=1234023 RepID=K1YNC7_9BACT|nr:MAG: hypothetical protein ACD_71C00124G0007 [uncultured bacterium (gcode 4)]
MIDFLIVALLLILSGILWKTADGHMDNGTTFGKRYTYFYDVAWAVIWCYLFFYSHNLYIVLVSIVFYWVYKLKFDFTNHGVCLITFIVGIIYYNNVNHDIIDSYGVYRTLISILVLLGSYIFLSYIKKYNKAFWFITSIFVPSLFAIYTRDPLAGFSVFFLIGWLSAMRIFHMKQKSFIRD